MRQDSIAAIVFAESEYTFNLHEFSKIGLEPNPFNENGIATEKNN